MGSVALASEGRAAGGFVRSYGKDGVGHRRCSRRGDGESTAPIVQSPPLNATDPEMALDGWQGMRVRKASKQEAEEEEAVRNLIALLRQLHAFRSEAISQVEALLDGDRGSAGR